MEHGPFNFQFHEALHGKTLLRNIYITAKVFVRRTCMRYLLISPLFSTLHQRFAKILRPRSSTAALRVRQQGVVDTTCYSNERHRPDERRHRKRHRYLGSHSVGEGGGEQRGQDPHRYLQPLSCGAPRCRSLIRPQAGDEQD